MFFKSKPSPAVTLRPVVCYMKSSEGKQFDRDVALLDAARAQFPFSFTLSIERESSNKLGEILSAAVRDEISTVIIQDFSHLGFSKGDLSSALGDLFAFYYCKVRLISVRDGFDSKEDGMRTAVNMLLDKLTEPAA